MRKSIYLWTFLGFFILLFFQDYLVFSQAIASVSQPADQNPSQPVQSRSVKAALHELENRFKVFFNYNERVLKNKQTNVMLSEVPDLEEALKLLLEPIHLKYEKVGEKYYSIFDENQSRSTQENRRKKLSTESINHTLPDVSLQESIQTNQEIAFTISGQVTSEINEAIPGVNVLLKGTTIGTTTNVDGNYTLSVPDGNGILVFSYIGYTTQEVPISNRTTIDISLIPDIQSLSEVVVVGYGTQNRRDLTGAVASVKEKDLKLVNAASVDNMLQGKVPGLNITTPTAQPGGNVNVNIRGILSPRGSNQPLYVIDGVPILNNSQVDDYGSGNSGFEGSVNRNPLNSINPNDIVSVDVLKDASASAIYGSAAANGVILITTKRGQEGKPTVTYSANYSIQTPKAYLEPFNATEFMTYHNLYAEELWRQSNKIAPYGTVDPSTVKPFIRRFSETDITNAGIGTDWMDYVIRNGRITDHNISVSGGAARTRYYTSFNFYDQKAVLENSGMRRYSGRLNLDQEIGSRIKMRIGLAYSEIDNQNVSTGNQHPDSPSMLQSALRFSPTFAPFDSNGQLSVSYLSRTPNPQSWLMLDNTTTNKRLLFTPNVEIKLLENLNLTLVGGLDQNKGENNMYVPVSARFESAPEGMAQLGSNEIRNYTGEGYLTFNKALGRSNLSVVAGAGYYKTTSETFGMLGYDFFTDAFRANNIAIAANRDRNTLWSGRLPDRTKLSQFVRINYSILDRYIITFNGRRDGSSIWAEGNRWGIFPGISGAWIVSEEAFMSDIKPISNLKFRAGYGTVGNEGLGGNYAYTFYGTGFNDWRYAFGNPGQISIGVLQTQLGNSDLKWETDITFNTGIDFGLFNNRISGSVDYYIRTAKDLFDFQTLPSANAIGRIGANIGSTRSTGVEIALNTENINRSDITWTTNFTLGTNRSYWLERNAAVPLPAYVGANDPINAVYGWKTDGIINTQEEIPAYQTNANVGNIKYVDVSGDGKLDIDDVRYLGDYNPRAFFGLGNTVTFKGFDLNVFIYGNTGGLQYDQWRSFSGIAGAVSISSPSPANAERHALNTWTSFNTNAKYPGIAPDPASSNNPSANNDFTAREVTFGRLRNITLGYTLPTDLLSRTRFIHSARLFVDLQNVAVWGNYSGLDPEMERYTMPYPIARTTSFGINIDFK
jgi:TonB-linked SusC/RagA family outer membrane protein